MTTDRQAPLLTVKQAVPPRREGAVRRDRLDRYLSASRAPLTLVAAPAGWGKTSLLSGWAATLGDDVRLAWVSLDAGDNEPVRFWRYVIGALRTASDAVSTESIDALAAPGLRPLDLAVPVLLNELAVASEPHVLVLDDFHLISNPEVHEELEYFLAYQPGCLQLVLASRQDPPLPLARMRARGQLTELRADDLRFTPAEATAMLNTLTGRAYTDGFLADVWERTEGWAAGLQLAGLLLRTSPDDDRRAVVDDDRHLLDYFAAEVIPGLTSEQYDLLVGAAPLERMSGALCDAALGRTGSATVLDELDRASLFVGVLDTHREWYRCHQLFREALLREASRRGEGSRPEPGPAEVLHAAAVWYEDRQLYDEAAGCLLRAGEVDAAARLLESRADWFFDRGLASAYLSLGDALPDETVTPPFALSLVYAAEACRRPGRIAHWLDVCERGITPETTVRGWRSVRAAAVMMRGLVGTAENDTAHAVELTRRALELERDAGAENPRTALLALGSALTRDGGFTEAATLLQEAWATRDLADWSSAVDLQLAGLLGLSLSALGRRDDVDRLLREAVPLADHAERDWGSAAAPLVLGLRLVQGRQLYQAAEHEQSRATLRHAVAPAAAGRATYQVLGLAYLADAELACGDRPAARSALTRARELITDEPVPAHAVAELERAEARIGRRAVAAAALSGRLMEELTDRELAILRTLPGSATQREIGAALYLSINTIKAYNKNLYRKLGVSSRQEAVTVARQLGLI